MLRLLTVPVTNDRTPRYMERALAAIHQACPANATITLFYGALRGRVGLFVDYPKRIEPLVCGPITANYPDGEFTVVETDDPLPKNFATWSMTLHLTPELLPILRHAQFEDLLNRTFADPITSILKAVTPTDDVRASVAIRIARARPRRVRVARYAMRLLERDFFRRHYRLAEYFAERITRRRGRLIALLLGLLARQSSVPHHSALDTSAVRSHEREEDLQAASTKIGGHLFETQIELFAYAVPQHEHLARERLQQLAGAFGAFTQPRLASFHAGPVRRGHLPSTRQGSLLSHEEIATLFHPPTATAAAERMNATEFRELEPPPVFHAGDEEGAVTLGRVLYRGDFRLVGLDAQARRRHLYVVGATGAGKSTLLLNLMQQDMAAGRGLTVIDVHGDLAAQTLALVPKHRTNDAILFEPAGHDAVPFNPLACSDPARVDQVTSGVVSACRKLYDSWGPRLENLLRNATFMIVEQQGTLLDMLRVLTDAKYRDHAIAKVRDEVVRAFWQNEFAGWTGQYRNEAVSSVTNKLMPFLASTQMRHIIAGSGGRSLNVRHVMDRGQILIANLSRGLLGQDNATLLGSLLLTAVEQAALTRAELPEADRRDHFLYLDEFQSLVTPSTAIMLSESRKYRVGLTLSHQLTHQLDPATYHAVIGNCGTVLSFRVGLEDAEILSPAFSKYAGQLSAADLCNLPNYTAYVRLLDPHGHPTKPFSIQTLPPAAAEFDRSDIVRQVSRRQHAATGCDVPAAIVAA